MEPNNYPYFPPHYTEPSSTRLNHEPMMSQEKENRSSLLLITEPKDLDKLFDTGRSLEQDICFPNNTSRHSTSSTMLDKPEKEIKRKSSNSSIDLNALALFKEIQIHTPQPKHYYSTDQKQQLLSLYGDNSRDDTTQQFPTLPHRQPEDRFNYYHLDTGCIKAPTLSDLSHPHLTLKELLLKENYWIDITCPSNEEMKAISKVRRHFYLFFLNVEKLIYIK